MRNRALDVYKGISILCIVLLHFENGIFPTEVNVYIGSFMISAFYAVAGWIAGQRDQVEPLGIVFNKRLRSLGLPYIYFSVIILLFDLIMMGFGLYDGKFLLKELYKMFVLRGIGTLWFLPALFGAEICLSYFRERPLSARSMMVIGALVYLFLYNTIWVDYRGGSDLMKIIDAPLRTLNNVFYGFIIVSIAYYFSVFYKKNGSFVERKIMIGVGLTSAIFCCFILYAPSRFATMQSNPYILYGFYTVFQIVLTFSMIAVSWVVSKTFLTSFFEFWGRNSLVLMVTHYSIILELFIVFDRMCGRETFTGWPPLFYAVITVLITYPLVWLFNTKVPFLIGKRA